MNLLNFSVNSNPTIREFYNMKFLDRRIFRLTAEERFSKLDKDYISKKFKEEKFPIEGNNLLGKMIYNYIKTNLSYFKRKSKITLLDIGSAGGALTTIFALKALHIFDLMKKTEVILVDIAEPALDSTIIGNFSLPFDLISKYGLNEFDKNSGGIKQILAKSKFYSSDLIKLPRKIKNIDICISGFTHHHLNIFDKLLACKEMVRVTRKEGFIGIVDESLSYKEYLKWLHDHKDERNSKNQKVPIAQESFISIMEHISMFSHTTLLEKENKDKYYCFSLKKS